MSRTSLLSALLLTSVFHCGWFCAVALSAGQTDDREPPPPYPGSTPLTSKERPAMEPGYLGLIADDRKDQGKGVRIVDIAGGSPAATAGLQTDDLITSINGQDVRRMDDMAREMSNKPPGAKLTFSVNRGGTQRQVSVTLGKRPPRPIQDPQALGPDAESEDLPLPAGTPAPPTPRGRLGRATPAAPPTGPGGPRLGIRTLPVTEAAQRQNQLENTSGAIVNSVTVGSPADRAGIPIGAVITMVNQQPIADPQELAAAVRAVMDDELELTYVRDGEEFTKTVALTANAPTPQAPPRAPAPMPSEGPALEAPSTQRIDLLEERIRELEERLSKLEAALNEQPNP